jgi:hypothetical protein
MPQRLTLNRELEREPWQPPTIHVSPEILAAGQFSS